MSRSAKQERAEQILGELAELGLMLARDVAADARAAEDPDQKVALTDAFQKLSRTVRLTLALDAKLDRDAARDAREAARTDAEAEDARLRERRGLETAEAARPSREETQKRRVTAVLNRLIWDESEGDQEAYDVLLEDLDARLYEAEDAPGFADLPIEVLAHKLKTDMRLSGELVVTTAADFTPANDPPIANTG